MYKELKDWQWCVIGEKQALDAKISKLKIKLGDHYKKGFPISIDKSEELNAMEDQLAHMAGYSGSLNQRIIRFT